MEVYLGMKWMVVWPPSCMEAGCQGDSAKCCGDIVRACTLSRHLALSGQRVLEEQLEVAEAGV